MNENFDDTVLKKIQDLMNSCYNCNEVYEPRKDKNGMIPTEKDTDYMCLRCSKDTTIRKEDYRKELPCKNENCDNTYWDLKRSDRSIECYHCCVRRYYGI